MREQLEILTKSDKETKKLARNFAKILIKENQGMEAMVISMEGDLGAGKTTFTQGFAEGLGIKEKIQSPTFVILKIYPLRRRTFLARQFIHVDAYRLGSKDFAVLGWQDFVKNNHNIMVVEWGDKIKTILPKNSIRIVFAHQKNPKHRLIKFLEK